MMWSSVMQAEVARASAAAVDHIPVTAAVADRMARLEEVGAPPVEEAIPAAGHRVVAQAGVVGITKARGTNRDL